MPLRALYDGLSYIFRGYKPSLNELYNDPEMLRSRYQALSERLGERFALREDLLKFFGYQLLRDFNAPDRAVRYFEMATEAYPRSWAAWESLGEAYLVTGDKDKAGQMYERSLTMNPQNENAKRMLKLLRGE
jgi:tetratricopeptide (TPR) repeat protein